MQTSCKFKWRENDGPRKGKKNIICSFGLVQGVARTLYIDKSGYETVYPLDDKLGLINIKDTKSRYTQRFAHILAELVVEMPEKRAVEILNLVSEFKLGIASIPDIVISIGDKYLPETDADIDMTDSEQGTPPPHNDFVRKKIEEIESKPDKDEIVKAAVEKSGDFDKDVKGSNVVENTVFYLSCDGTGVPGIRTELEGKKGRQSDGSAKTFEAKIGVCFKQDFDGNGCPLLSNGVIFRRNDSNRYTGTVEKVNEFGPMLYNFSVKNGIDLANQIVFLGDGAVWIWRIKNKYFPNAIAIVDKFHAIENLNKIIDKLRFNKVEIREEFRERCQALLSLGDIERLDEVIMNKTTKSNETAIGNSFEYFRKNKERMQYGLFTAAGLFVGSGVVEAACKTIVCSRLKRAGAHWSKKIAANIIAIRCAIMSKEFDKHLPKGSVHAA